MLGVLLGIAIVLLTLNLLRTRTSSVRVVRDNEYIYTPVIVPEYSYVYGYPWWGGYGSGGYSGGISHHGGGHGGGGHGGGGHGGGGHGGGGHH